MKRNPVIARFLLSLAVAALGGAAASVSAQSPDSDGVNLAGRDFFKAYTSPDGQMREKAKLYLLGVQDSTEGRVWCSYKRLKMVTLKEAVYEHFRKLPSQRLDERAASLIEATLAKEFPCGGPS
ncbi:MAG TPA: Rap1a/Tai family immunity protein [Ideonella sp.]|uniref:Rap1a/Tai family immunity protein n=1 Tax=Ideonella sp. TaxID=1929293 RepID=UPI002E3624D3|nr:Rap1a/Tai family immunity protein [Ideonella sp.]HEX5686583.1 Rap1a/Tai family immunity protein [Ideonella sp.]